MSVAMGFFGAYHLIKTHYFEDREVEELYIGLPVWQQRALKIIDVLGNVSLILGALVSCPASALWKWGIQKVCTPEKIECLFGCKGYISGATVYRRTAMLAFLLGIPSTLKTIYLICRWVKNRYMPVKEPIATPLSMDETDIVVTARTISQIASRSARFVLNSPHK